MKKMVIVLLIVVLLVVIGACQDGTSSFYIDSNGNGSMDRGEHVYDQDSDGTVHWDSDGDGWWDTNESN